MLSGLKSKALYFTAFPASIVHFLFPGKLLSYLRFLIHRLNKILVAKELGSTLVLEALNPKRNLLLFERLETLFQSFLKWPVFKKGKI